MNSILGGTLRSRLVIITAIVILILGNVNLYAALKVLRVNPQQTDPAIVEVHGPHIALYDMQVPSAHRLFVFFVGTGSKAGGSLTIDSAFARLGYHAIGLDYENNVLTASLRHGRDTTTFGRYHEAIVTGKPVSDAIKVDPANSILNRLQKLLVYLVAHDPGGGWGEFLTNGQPVWSRIVVAGHSQGSGHAAYVGKLFSVDRVLMFSGPQDYMIDLDRPAPWLALKGATPPSRFFAFLNLNDPFNVHYQIANCMALMDMSKPNTLMVKPGEIIHGDYHILVNSYATHPHGSTLRPEFENVWDYLGTTGGEDARVKTSLPTPPQPPSGH